MRYTWLAAAAAAAAALSCGGTQGPSPEHERAKTSQRGDYPALAFAPADASYLFTAARLRDATMAARELVGALGLVTGVSLSSAIAELRLGDLQLLRDAELEGLGLDLEGGFALFSRGYFPTLVARVADPERLDGRLQELVPGSDTSVRRVRGHEVYTWSEEKLAISWVAFDSWFAARVYDPRADPETGAWFERILAESGQGPSRQISKAVAVARRHMPQPAERDSPGFVRRRKWVYPGVVGIAHPARVVASFPAGPRELGAACASLVGGDQLVVAADMVHRGGRGIIVAQLAETDATALLGQLPGPLPSGLSWFLAEAAISVELGINPADSLEALAKRCPWIPPLSERMARGLGPRDASRYVIAGSDLQPSSSSARLAVWLEHRGQGFVEALLARIPLRSTFERVVRIAGVEVVELAAPLLPMVHYQLDSRHLLAATGKGVMEQVLSEARPLEGPAGPPASHPRPGQTVLAAFISPARLPELAAVMALVAKTVSWLNSRVAQDFASRLGRYRDGSLRVALVDQELVVSLGMRLR